MKQLLVGLLMMGFALHAPLAQAAEKRSLWQMMKSIFGREISSSDNTQSTPPPKIPLTAMERLMLLQDPTAEITDDGIEKDENKKLALYYYLKEFDVEGVWIAKEEDRQTWQALRVWIIRKDAEIFMKVDYWKDGQVFRLMSKALQAVVDQKVPYRLTFSVKGVNPTSYGRIRAPLELNFIKLDERIFSFRLYARDTEVLHFPVMRPWEGLKPEERDAIATTNLGGVTMSQFRLGNYPFPEKFEVCRRYLGED